jgi:hypothetical protein
MMHRAQISLEPELQRRARAKAQAQGISFSEYLRRLIARDLGEPMPRASPSAVFDLGDSGGADGAGRERGMAGEAAAARRARAGR